MSDAVTVPGKKPKAMQDRIAQLEAENERLKIIQHPDGWQEKVLSNYFMDDEFRQTLHRVIDSITDGEWVTLSIYWETSGGG